MRTLIAMLSVLALIPTSTAISQNIEEKAKKISELTLDLPNVPKWLKTFKFEQAAFTFVRIRYESFGFRNGQGRAAWATDYPDADFNFATQLGKFTGLDVSKPTEVVRLTDPELKKYPFIYISEPGAMALKDEEVVALRDYLNGGGFLLVDDFWDSQWNSVEGVLKRVFPDRKPRELPLEHPLFHCVFEFKEKPQVLSFHNFLYDPKQATTHAPKYYAIEDDNGRVMALMCHNNDLADGWERVGENATYKRDMSEAKAFPMGFNIVYYALTGGKVKPK